jgi:hypothetical protein
VIATILSTVLLALTIILFVGWPAMPSTSPPAHYLSITDDFHVGFYCGYIAFYNDVNCGPFHGGIIHLSDSSHPVHTDKAGFGETLGIYYRYYHWWDSGEILWTLLVSLIYPAAVFSILPVTWLWRRWRQTHRLPTDSSTEGNNAR